MAEIVDGPGAEGHGQNARPFSVALHEHAKIIGDYESEIKALHDQIKAKGKLKRKARRALKNECGISLEEFDLARKYIELEDEERDDRMHSFRACYDALRAGEQLDFIAAFQQADEPGTPLDAG